MIVDCKWSDYGDWSNCNEPCGNGTEYATRIITRNASFGGLKCQEKDDRKLRTCNRGPCSRKNDFRSKI